MGLKEDLARYAIESTKGFESKNLEDQISNTVDTVREIASKSAATTVHDHFGNIITSTGTDDKIASFNTYGFDNDTLNWTLWLALYNDSWVFRRAIDKPAQDEINCGISIHGDKDYTKIYKAYDRYKADLIRLLMWGSLFGGSVAVMMFDTVSDEEMSKPLNREKIKGARMRLYVTDRWYGVAVINNDTVTNMKDIDFGKPKMYSITFADGKMLNVHHSYVLRYEHRTAPPLIKQGQLQGWGYAEGAHIINELARDDQLKASITSLINKALIEVVKMSGMRGVFMGTDSGNEDQLRKRLEMVNWARSSNSLTFLDKDDEYQQFTMQGISGLAELLEKNMWLISAALEMQGILYGDLKGGLSQESDAFRRYAVTILNRCNSYVRPVIQKFLIVLFYIYDIEGPVDFDFNSLIKKEENNEKVEAINNYVSLLAKLGEMGIISKYQSALSIKNFMENDVVNINFTEENLNALKLEEEYQILDILKNAGKASNTPRDIVGSQFGSTSEMPEKLEYLNPEAGSETNSSSSQATEQETEETEEVEQEFPEE